MSIIQKMNLKAKLTISTSLAMIVSIFIVVFVLLNESTTLQKQTILSEAGHTAEKYAGQVQTELEKAMSTSRTLAHSLAALKEHRETRRGEVGQMLKRVLAENPAILGTYTCWEPNAFDGRDAAFAGTEGHDATGRFVPYYNRAGGNINVEPLADYDQVGPGDYYQIPKRQHREAIINAYDYEVGGQKILLTSLVVPIMVHGRFMGIVGMDLSLDEIQKTVASIKPYETGVAALFCNDGTVAGHFDPTRLGKQMRETERDMSGDHTEPLAEAIESGRSYAYTIYSKAIKSDLYIINAPVHVGSTDTPWGLTVGIPMNKVMAPIKTMRTYAISIGLATILLGAFLMFLYASSFTKPIMRVVDMIQDIAQGDGDLTQRLAVNSADEIGQLAKWFNTFIDNLHGIINQVKMNTEEVATASNQISATSAQMAAGAEEQAAQAGEVAASVQQMSAAIVENSQNAQQTATMASSATDKAREGSEAMQKTKSGMLAIVDSAKGTSEIIQSLTDRAGQIDGIVQVINDIADQTNLLALNAAIEAARAGEQGRGFAVVADEVRKLAERTTQATAEIGETIKAIQEDTKNAADSMTEAGENVTAGQEATYQTESILAEIITAVEQAMGMIQQIAAASEEQSAGAEQISKAVEAISTVSHQSAGGAEELAATSEELNKQSDNLRTLVGRFRLE